MFHDERLFRHIPFIGNIYTQIYDFNARYEEELKKKLGTVGLFSLTWKLILHSSKTSLKKLKKVSILDLIVNEPGEGFYILLQSIVDPQCDFSCLRTVVEDDEGNVVWLILYHFLTPGQKEAPTEYLKRGTIFILKEPLMSLLHQDPTLRIAFLLTCMTPTDVVIIQRHSDMYEDVKTISWINDERPSQISREPDTAVAWKNQGNSFFKENKLNKAQESYFMALKLALSSQDGEIILLIHLNLAATFLKNGYFEAALEHATKVLNLQPLNMKALFRAGRSCYELRKYQEAHDYFQTLLENHTSNKETVEEQARCITRLKEAKGEINIDQLCNKARKSSEGTVDCADYLGPCKIVPISGKGNGVVVTQGVKPGTLLMVSKALVSVEDKLPQLETGIKVTDVSFNIACNLTTIVTHCVYKNPMSFGKQLYDLTSNNATLDNNKQLFCDAEGQTEPISDIELIIGILKTNRGLILGSILCSGIFYHPSFINHSCIPNAELIIHKNIAVLHSIKEIKSGEEISVAYNTDMHDDFLDRHKRLNHCKIICYCVLCEQDRKEPFSSNQARENAYRVYKTLIKDSPGRTTSESLEKIIGRIENSYPPYSNMRVALIKPYLSLAKALIEEKKYNKVLNVIEKALNAVGLSVRILLKTARKRPEDITFSGSVYLSPLVIWAIGLLDLYCQVKGLKDEVIVWRNARENIARLFTGCYFSTLEKYRIYTFSL